MTKGTLLDVRHLSKAFSVGGLLGKKKLIAVDDVSFTLPAEKPIVLTLAGESGSGKTTTARLILGDIKPTSGKIFYRGKNIHTVGRKKWNEYYREVQAIFQDPYGTP